jgi:hypothetical protein
VPVSTTVDRVRGALSSVESAALSGVGAAALLSIAVYLLQRQPGVGSSSDDLQWYADSTHRFTVFVGLNLAALGVVAFLWFMAVVRRRLGEREDQLLATVFPGRWHRLRDAEPDGGRVRCRTHLRCPLRRPWESR